MSGVSGSDAEDCSAAVVSDIVLMDIAPAPIRFHCSHDGMAVVVRVSPRVSHRRRIAATDMPAGEAEPQMHPRRPEPQALLAPRRTWRDLPDGSDIRVES